MNKKLNVLIVDDSKNLRQITIKFLESEFDFTIFEAANGEDAEAVLQEQSVTGEPIAMIVLDWMMPHMTGMQFLEKMRATNSGYQNTPVIMLSAETYVEQILAAQKLGVSDYITKPFTKDQLVTSVSKIIGKAGKASGF